MPRLLVHVEGHTEEAFLNEVLGQHLLRSGFSSVSVRLLGNPHLRSRRGGICRWDAARRDILRHLREDTGVITTTMVDYYALPTDWPGRAQAPQQRSSSDKGTHVEVALTADICQAMGQRFDERRFIPFVMMHEFEALLFSDPDRFAHSIRRVDLAQHLHAIRQRFETPEDINDSFETAPSRQILRLFPAYQKRLSGVNAASEIGVEHMRQECPHFNSWLRRIEMLPQECSSLD